MSDPSKVLQDELTAVMAKITEYSTRARKRDEAYLNSNFADMPMWDRMMVEMVIDTTQRMSALEKDMEELKALFAPAPELLED